MQHESSITHRKNLETGLTVEWFRTTGFQRTDDNWSVVCYSDGSRWIFTNGYAEQITLIGEVKDGLNKSEILQTDSGSIVALYSEGPQMFEGREAWVESLAEFDKPEAKHLLAQV